MKTLDDIFPLDQCDEEMGDVYEKDGWPGIYQLQKRRAEAQQLSLPDAHIRYQVAEAFGCSPGDLTEGTAHLMYMMGQVT